ncbi:MAG: aminotransferase class I/II-fold pyridoxal phosphate-dependent enzyme [Candidatus Omnitrophota bacterium]
MKNKRIILSKKVIDMAPSGIRAFFDLVLGMKDVISLGVGEPDFVTPWNIRETAIHFIEQGFTTYTSNKGLNKLRLQISRFLEDRHDLHYSPEDEILITVGVSEALDLAVRSIINPGDEVLIPQPCYVSYAPVVHMAYGRPKFLSTTSDNNFKITPEQIKKSCTQKTKAIILNYPANPTGISYTRSELAKIVNACLENNIIIISDEIYDELTYDFEHTPLVTLKGTKKNAIYLNGFSKAYAMTGWRVGYACGPKELISAMTKIHQYTMLCTPTISQFAACEALQGGVKSVLEMKKEYKRRREFIFEGLNRLGLTVAKPQGAFYIFPSIKSTGLSSIDFSNRLLKEKRVAVIPGTAFGKCGEGYIRISYASSLESLKEALLRMEEFL